MAAIMCHGLHSCLESQVVESRTTIRLSLPFSKSLTPLPQPLDLTFKSTFRDSNSKTHHYSEERSTKSDTIHDNKGGWSFLQVLSNVGTKESSEKESVYVHPQVKRSSLMLSEKSLELCTENLGNETGTTDNVVGNNNIELLCSSSKYGGAGNSPTRAAAHGGKKTKAKDFPPPLTTISGSESLRVRPHRENGRLVIEAVRVTSSPSCFKAERSNGRLRLCLVENRTTSFDYEEADTEIERERSDGEYGTEEEEENDDVEVEEEEEEDEDGEREGFRVKKCERPKRCKEGENENNELLNWEPLWITSS